MFGALKEIGEVVLFTGQEFKIETKLKGENQFLAKVIFNLDTGKLECDYSFKCTQKTAEEYLWVGNARGQKSQLVLTTDNPKYLLDPSKPKKWAIGQIIDTFDKKINDTDIMNLLELLKEIKVKFFLKMESYIDELDKLLGKEKEKVALYTTCVKKNGVIVDLVKLPGYKKLLYYVAYESVNDEYPIMHGVCHICGLAKDVLTNPSYREGTILCIYNLDKAGFMPGLSRDPLATKKAHAVCIDCKRKLLLGLSFVEEKLTFSIGTTSKQSGKVNVFLIPKVLGIKLTPEILDGIASKGSKAFGAVNTYKSLEDIQQLMDDLMKLDKMYGSPSIYYLNILFGYGESSHFHFQHLIQDVPIMRLLMLSRIMASISNEVAGLFMERSEKWSIGFEDIYSILPLKVRKGKIIDWKPLIELFESLLNGKAYPKDNIISKAVLFAQIHRYGTYEGYNIRQPPKNSEEVFCNGLLKYNMLIKLMEVVGVIEMEKEGTVSSSEIPDKSVEDFFSKMNYVEWQKALFLLGFLVGKIGTEQYNKGDGKKAVLNKITFEGMSVERVKLLANSVLEGLRNYRLLNSFNEATYACMKAMLDRNLESLRNPIDNVFYILSGYAYATLQAIKGGK